MSMPNYPENNNSNPFGDMSQAEFDAIVNAIVFDDNDEHDKDMPSDQQQEDQEDQEDQEPPYNEPVQLHPHPSPVTATELNQRIALAWEGDSTLSQPSLILRAANDQGQPQSYNQVSLSYCDLPLLQGFEGISMRSGQFEKAFLPHAHLPSADLGGSNWQDAIAYHLNVPAANFTSADVRRADFSHAKFASATIVHALCDQANFSHAQLDQALCTQKSSFYHGKFLYASCRETDFTEAILRGADFTGADLTGANLTMASMQHARLAGTRLIGCTMTRTDLHYADLFGVRLGPDTAAAIGMLERADTACVRAACKLLTLEVAPEQLRAFRETLRTPETLSGDPVHVQLGLFVPSGLPDRLASRDQTLEVQHFLNGAYPLQGEDGTLDPEHNPMPILALLGRWLDAVLPKGK